MESKKDYNKKYYEKNKVSILESVRRYYIEHRDIILNNNKVYGRKYSKKPEVKKRREERRKEYFKIELGTKNRIVLKKN